MLSPRFLPALAASLVLLAIGFVDVGAGAYSSITASVDCSNGTTAVLSWSQLANPENLPDPFPAWVGYDVYRRSVADCEPYVRLNAEIIPKAPLFQRLTWNDTPPSQRTFEYHVLPVDADRQTITIPFCDVYTRAWTSCPELSAPAIVGRIQDWGWALYIQPCAEGCWPGAFFEDQPWVTELRPYAGTNTVFRFYGGVGCCAVEGPGIEIDRYEIAQCGPTPTARASWGQLKAIYR